MTWYQTLTLLEIIFGLLFVGLYLGYLLRIRRVASFFGQRPHGVWVKFVLRHAYAVLLVIAILGPSFGAMTKEIKTIGKDIYIAVDLSASMDATDVSPSRLERAKRDVLRLINRFNSDRIGLIVFDSEAYLQSPLTYDQQALELYTQTLRTDLLPHGGTSLVPVLEMVSQKFGRAASPEANEQKARILVLISDGEDFGDKVDDWADRLREQQIRVFALGIGTTDGGQIPAGKSVKLDRLGNPITTRLQPQGLERLAEATDGEYFEVNGRISEVSRLINAINNIEGELRESKTIDVTANKYVYPLALALLLILLDMLITVKLIRI